MQRLLSPLLAWALLLTACAPAATPTPTPGSPRATSTTAISTLVPTTAPTTAAGEVRTIRGTVTQLEPPFDGTTARQRPRGFTLKTGSGQELTFTIGDAVNAQIWNMLHLNSHLQSGEPVLVRYQETPSGSVAVELQE